MIVLICVLVLCIGFTGGWCTHRQISRRYKELWMKSVAQLQDKSLFADDEVSMPQPSQVPHLSPSGIIASPYVPGKWVLLETYDSNDTATFRAIRRGHDPIDLGKSTNYKRFKALYRRDKEEAMSMIDEMNKK